MMATLMKLSGGSEETERIVTLGPQLRRAQRSGPKASLAPQKSAVLPHRGRAARRQAKFLIACRASDQRRRSLPSKPRMRATARLARLTGVSPSPSQDANAAMPAVAEKTIAATIHMRCHRAQSSVKTKAGQAKPSFTKMASSARADGAVMNRIRWPSAFERSLGRRDAVLLARINFDRLAQAPAPAP